MQLTAPNPSNFIMLYNVTTPDFTAPQLAVNLPTNAAEESRPAIAPIASPPSV